MGWLWSSSPAPSSGGPPSATAPPTASTASQTHPSSSSAAPGPSSSADDHDSSKLSPDELELQKFFSLLQEDRSSSSSKTAAAPTPADLKSNAKPSSSILSSWKTPWSSSAGSDSEANGEQLSSSPPFSDRDRSLAEAVLPTSMSCQQAFDLAWGCQSPVGQWRAVYRHGSVRPCSDLWEDFWFCMRVKSFSPGLAKEEAIRSHYRKREMDKYYAHGRRSSEDVWRSRTLDEVLAPSDVFNQPFQAVLDGGGGSSDTPAAANADVDANSKPPASEQSDAEKIRADLERRRLIRQQLGYEK